MRRRASGLHAPPRGGRLWTPDGLATAWARAGRDLDSPDVQRAIAAGLPPIAGGATAVLYPNADVTTGWTPDAGAHWDGLDDAVTQPTVPTLSDYIFTTSGSQTDELALTTVTIGTVTSVAVWVYRDGNNAITVSLRKGATQIASGNTTGGVTGWSNPCTYTGNLTQAEVDDLRIRVVSNAPSPNNTIYAMYAEVTYSAATAVDVVPGAIGGTSSISVLVTAATKLALAGLAGSSSLAAAISAPTRVQPGAMAGTSSLSAGVSIPQAIAPAALAGSSGLSAAVSAPARIAAAGLAGGSSLAISLVTETRILPGSIAGGSSVSVAITAPLNVPRPTWRVTRPEIRMGLHAETVEASGRKLRWGNEEEPPLVPTGLPFSTTLPGGFGQGRAALVRDLRDEYRDVGLLRSIRYLGAGGRVAYAGRIQSTPGSGGGAESTIEAISEGWWSHASDNPTFQEVLADQDLTKWKGISLPRELALRLNRNDPTGGEQIWDTIAGIPALNLSIARGARKASPICESWWDGGDLKPKKVYYDYAGMPDTKGNYQVEAEPNFNVHLGNAADEAIAGTWEATGELAGSHASAGYLTVTTPRRYLWMQLSWELTTWDHEDATDFAVRFGKVTAYGNHGLPLYGPDPQGVLGSDVIPLALSRVAPLLRYTTGVGGSIEPSTFVIPHLSFMDPVTAREVVEAVTALGGANNRANDYGCYGDDGRLFFHRSPGSGAREWIAPLSSSTSLKEEGPRIEDAINGVVVVWTDPAGVQHRIGPPGSGLESTSSTLQDLDTQNPANENGLTRWATLTISGTTVYTIALQVGALFLNEALQRKVAGDVTHVGPLLDSKGIWHPPWAARSGDVVRIPNLPDPGPFRVVGTDYDGQLTETMSLDAPPARLDVMIERLQQILAGAL